MATPIQLRRGTASAWTSANPLLRAGEPGVELDSGPLLKIGDGVRAWTDLPYLGLVGPTGPQGPIGVTGATGPAGPSVWGGITGLIANQTDLQAALNGKAPLASPTFTGTVTLANLAFAVTGSAKLWDLTAGSTGDGVNFGYVYNKAVFASGGVGNEAYVDDVVQWGFNVGPTVAVPAVAGKAQASYTIENKFFATSPAKYGSELHMSLVDTAGVNHRATSYFLPHDGGTGSGANEAIDYINWTDWAGNQRVQWHLLNKQGSFADSFVLQFIVNNVPVVKQFNAAGNALLNLPYFNADNRLAVTNPFSFVGGAPPTTGSFPNIFGVIQSTSIPAGGTLLDLEGPGVTGAYSMLMLTGVASTNLTIDFTNAKTSAAAAHAKLNITTTTTGGDPFVKFNVGGGLFWSVGVDNSDGAKWKCAWQGDLGTSGDFLILDGVNAIASLKAGTKFGAGVTAPTAYLHVKAGTTAASTAPFKLTSGPLNTTAEVGAHEFLTDDFFATITTGAARKAFVLDDGARLTSGKIPIATTNGRLIDGPTPLAGTKVYYVSDTSGGAVTRKLTFTNGILTAET